MAGPMIKSSGELKQYVLRKLGFPLHQIEITDDQLNDVINETFKDFTQVAYSGINERFIPVQLVKDVQNYILPYSTFACLAVCDWSMSMIGANMPSNMFSMNQFIAADLYRPGVAKIDIIGYEMINQMTATLDLVFAKKQTFDYNSVSKILHLHGQVHDDTKVILHLYQKLELDTTPVSAGATRFEEENIYDERWIQKMCVARAKLQWGNNIGLKYQGTVLPNGGVLNGEGIISKAEAEIEKLEAELQSDYALPTDFYIG